MLRSVGRWAIWIGMTAGVVLVGALVLRQFKLTRNLTGQLPPEKSIPAWLKEKVSGKAA